MSSSLRSTVFAGSVALASVLSPITGHAQGVMAQDLWAAWQDGVAVAGGTLSATETREGNQLVLSDLRLDMGGEAGVLQLEKVRLINQADGSVGVILPDSFPLMFEAPPRAGAADNALPEVVFFRVDAPELTLIVRGLGEKAEFQAASPDITLTLDRIVPPLPKTEGELAISATLGGFDLRYVQDLGAESPMLDAALSFATLNGVVQLTGAPDGQGEVSLNIGPSKLAASGAIPLTSPAVQALQDGSAGGVVGLGDIAAVLDAGLRMTASASFDGATVAARIEDADGEEARVSFAVAQAGAHAGLDAAATGLGFQLAGISLKTTGDFSQLEGVAIDHDGSMEMSVDEYRFSLNLGLNGWRGPQDWSVAYILRNIVLPDEVWEADEELRDLPRDPLTMAIDLAGKYGLRPEALAKGYEPSATELPFDNFSFKINELALAGFGADAKGQGGLSFDFTDLARFQGVPAPSGKLSFQANGIYALIDLMHKRGDIEDADLTGVRAMLMAVAKAGTTPDSLISEIEFRDKSVYLNGIKVY
ncbi:DUF2125 domain-containing protein [Xinfangfangia sp. D13-10-4-6]|uniref:DUF2125 domain-containing protein n=1 Tax=Pseudogemmobacter hezensis TaxID=2737662 RepID=UPI0015529F65|nr:DUF2125 domain-containing protein [Pseudogemmobacter hezensis]NPD14227.1 DUF2125 domain-containing protein [Pseudogemmobacter hezensis]